MEHTDINPGIRRVVALINSFGFQTCDSGDGRTHDHPCDRDHGYVVVRLPPWADLIAASLWLQHKLSIHLRPDRLQRVTISASYNPRDGIKLIDVSPITDADLNGDDAFGAQGIDTRSFMATQGYEYDVLADQFVRAQPAERR